MALFDFSTGGQAKGNSTTGAFFAQILDSIGNALSIKHRGKVPSTQEALLVAGRNDEWGTFLRTDRKGNLLTGNYLPELIDAFEGATMNVQKWVATSTTFAPAQTTVKN